MQIENPDTQASALRLSGVDFENLHEIVRKARQNLDQNAWDYIVGGTESETTLRRNRMALDSIAFRPRVLRDGAEIGAQAAPAGDYRAGRRARDLRRRSGRHRRARGRRVRNTAYAQLG